MLIVVLMHYGFSKNQSKMFLLLIINEKEYLTTVQKVQGLMSSFDKTCIYWNVQPQKRCH